MILKGKNAIITGANRGIGLATVKKFAQEGSMFGHVQELRMMSLRVRCRGLPHNMEYILDQYVSN